MNSLIRLVHALSHPRVFALLLALLVPALATAPAAAAPIYWTGGGANSNWSNNDNWSADAPGSGDEAIFYQDALQLDNTSNTTRTINKLTFDANATSPVNINIASSNPLTLGLGGIEVLAGSHTITGTDPPGTGYHLRLPNSSTSFPVHVAENAQLTLAARLGDAGSSPRKTFTKTGDGTLILDYDQSGSNVVKPIWRINEGVLRITADGALGWSSNPVHVRNVARIELDGAGMGNSNSTTTLYGSGSEATATRIVNVSGTNTVSSDILLWTDGSRYGLQSDAGTLRITGEIRRGNATGTRHLFLRGAGDGIVLGNINGSGFDLRLIKQDAGTWTFAGDNSYTGGTTIEAGTLLVNNTAGSGTGSGNVVVNGGTLGGTGRVAGAVEVNSGGTLAPGESIGSLAVDNDVAFYDGSLFAWELNSTDLIADLLTVDGNLDLNGTVGLSLSDLSPAALPLGTTMTMMAYSGEWNDGIFDGYDNHSTFALGSNIWEIQYDAAAGGVNFAGGNFSGFVNLTAVPEPGSAALLAFGLLAWLLVRRRRR